MFLIKQGGGGKVRKMVVVPKCANVCTGTLFIKEERVQSSRNNEQGCVRACVREWVVGVKPSAVRYAGVTGSDRQPLV